MILEELKLRFALIDDEPSEKLCNDLARAIFSLGAEVEKLTSVQGLYHSPRASIDALQRAVVLCREHGHKLINEHPHLAGVRTRITLLIEFTNQMLADEIHDDHHQIADPFPPSAPKADWDPPLLRARSA